MTRFRLWMLLPAVLVAARPAVCAADEPSLPDVLARAAVYVDQFERTASGIVAEEHYVQQLRFPRRTRGGRDIDRTTRSDLLLVRPAGAESWLQFRDVYEVDGRAVRNRDERLVRLFVDPLEARNQRRFTFSRTDAREAAGETRQAPTPAGHFTVTTEVVDRGLSRTEDRHADQDDGQPRYGRFRQFQVKVDVTRK